MQKNAKYGMNLSIPYLLYINASKGYRLKDYYPFGMLMPQRNFSSSVYNFGYQGSLKDDEIKGSGNSYLTLFRELDPRIVQWWATDPEQNKTPWESPYVSMGNNPIWHNDQLGNLWGKPGNQGQQTKDAALAERVRQKANKHQIKSESQVKSLTEQRDNLVSSSKSYQNQYSALTKKIDNAQTSADKMNIKRCSIYLVI